MEDEKMPLTKLNNRIFRCNQAHMDNILKKFQLSYGSYPFLLVLKENEGISQNRISRELNVDKAMSARTIKKLIELDYINKVEDDYDSRAYKLYLTERAKTIIPQVIEELEKWGDLITEDLEGEEKTLLINLLNRVLNCALKYK